MKLDLTKPVQTRDGQPVRILCTDRKSKVGQAVCALVLKTDGSELLLSYSKEGVLFNLGGEEPTPTDLVNVPEIIEGWMNFYRSPHNGVLTPGYSFFSSAREAECAAENSENFVVTVHIKTQINANH